MFNKSHLIIIAILILFLPTAGAVTIHGTVYEWSTFEPLDNALIEVNSTPTQFRVASSGVYSFNLPPGYYLINTSYYQNDTLLYYSEDTLTVTDYEGDYVFDILLFPLYDEKAEDVLDEDIGNITYNVEDNILPGFDLSYTAVALLLFIIMAAAAYYQYKRKDVPETDKPEDRIASTESLAQAESVEPVEPVGSAESVSRVIGKNVHASNTDPTTDIDMLPEDLKEIMEILERSGGRMTQKDLRARLNCSEAKVSLMVTDLEDRGMVNKIKKGRGNVILRRF